MDSTKEDVMWFGFLIIGILAVVGLVMFVVDVNNQRDKECRKQYGNSWYYTTKYGADCIDKSTGDSRFFRG